MNGISELLPENTEEYEKTMKPLRTTFAPESAPTMPMINTNASQAEEELAHRLPEAVDHQEHLEHPVAVHLGQEEDLELEEAEDVEEQEDHSLQNQS